MIRADKVMRLFCVHLGTEILSNPLFVTQFIETMELLRVQGPKNDILAVGEKNHRPDNTPV
jgi:hypothetical protein